MLVKTTDGTPDAVKVARPVWSGGKSGDNFKGLPITIEMNDVAEAYLEKKLKNVEVHLVCIVVYNETRKLKNQTETEITKEIDKIIEERYQNFDNKKIPIEENIILNRITYIAFPIWKLDELLEIFQKEL